MKNYSQTVLLSAYACIFACVGEFASIFIGGAFYPGYSQLKDTMSQLGASYSPVSTEMSLWWITAGILLVFFAWGLKQEFSSKGRYAGMASFLLILYGLGECVGSGAFKADHLATGLTTSAIIHDIVGGIGVAAILIFPLVMMKVVSKSERPAFHRLSQVIFIAGICMVILFLFRYSTNEKNFLSVYKGVWQRLFMLNTYLYLTLLAVLVIKRQKSARHLPGNEKPNHEYDD